MVNARVKNYGKNECLLPLVAVYQLSQDCHDKDPRGELHREIVINLRPSFAQATMPWSLRWVICALVSPISVRTWSVS